jgi:hypothetical protein
MTHPFTEGWKALKAHRLGKPLMAPAE